MLSRSTHALAAFVAAVTFSACLNRGALPAQSSNAAAPSPTMTAAAPTPAQAQVNDEELTGRLTAICQRAGGDCAVALTHVETGRTVSVRGDASMPLYSVFKLPLAVAVLKDVEEGRLSLDQKVRVEPEEAAPGVKMNSDLWRKASDRTLRELLEFSLVRSDNTASDKMLELVGGPPVVTGRMRALGLQNIEVRASTREFLKSTDAHPNTGTAADLARLLARLQKGEVLASPQLEVLFGLMGRALTGQQRLRAGVPAGTPVGDKTGTGPSTTNDVGLVTLPDGRGRFAVAVLLNGSKLSAAEQEKVIAEMARAAYDAYVKGGEAGQ